MTMMGHRGHLLFCLVLEDEELVGLEEHAPKENPDGEPPEEAATAVVLAGLGDPQHTAPPPANACAISSACSASRPAAPRPCCSHADRPR
jgi:hypothetical protein